MQLRLQGQRRRDDNKNKICVFEGGGPWGQRGKSPQNTVFHGKLHDNKILKVQILLSRNFVVIAQAPTGNLTAQDSWGIDCYCNVMVGAVLLWKARISRLQLHFFSWRCVGISCCNVRPLLYRIYFCRNTIVITSITDRKKLYQ